MENREVSPIEGRGKWRSVNTVGADNDAVVLLSVTNTGKCFEAMELSIINDPKDKIQVICLSEEITLSLTLA